MAVRSPVRHACFASFAVGVVATLIVGIAVIKVASRWAFFSFFISIPAVATDILTTVVTTRP